MKRITCILICIAMLLTILCSCNKKAENDEGYIEFENEHTTKAPPVIEGDTPKIEDEVAEGKWNEPDYDPSDDGIHNIPTKKNWFFKKDEYTINLLGPIGELLTIDYNGIPYMWCVKAYQFPEGTVFEKVDLQSLTVTDVEVSVNYQLPSQLDGYLDPYKTETAYVLDMPDDMKNNRYVHMLAVKMKNGERKLFYRENVTEWQKDTDFYSALERLALTYPSDCLGEDKIDAIETTDGETVLTTTQTETLTAFYKSVSKLSVKSYLKEVPSFDNMVKLAVRFKDDSGMHLYYDRNKKELYYKKTVYEATQEFHWIVGGLCNKIETSDCTGLGDSFKDEQENEKDDLSGLNTPKGGTPLPGEEPIGTTGLYRFKSVKEIMAASDYVVVASPTQTYDEAKQCWFDWLMQPVDDFDKLSINKSFCVRPFKVSEVIKGKDKSITEINVCQNVLMNEGQRRRMTGNYLMEPGREYLIFLYKSDLDENQYFPFLFQGVYTFDYVTDAELWQINPTLYDEIEDKFSDKIKKEVD